MNFETDALITTLAMTYFRIDDINHAPGNVIPQKILIASNEQKQEWFTGHVRKLVQEFIVGKHLEEVAEIKHNIITDDHERQNTSFPCRFPECTRQYRYEKIGLTMK